MMKKSNPSRYVAMIMAILLCTLPAGKINAQKAFKLNTYAATLTGTIYVARDYKPVTFSRILVFTGVHNVEINRFVIDEFGKIGVAAFSGVGHFPPVRDYTSDEYENFFDERQIDGIIRTTIKDKWTTSDDILTSEVELSLIDVRTDMPVATVFAYVRSHSADPDRGMAAFFKAVVRELDVVFKSERDADH